MHSVPIWVCVFWGGPGLNRAHGLHTRETRFQVKYLMMPRNIPETYPRNIPRNIPAKRTLIPTPVAPPPPIISQNHFGGALKEGFLLSWGYVRGYPHFGKVPIKVQGLTVLALALTGKGCQTCRCTCTPRCFLTHVDL